MDMSPSWCCHRLLRHRAHGNVVRVVWLTNSGGHRSEGLVLQERVTHKFIRINQIGIHRVR